MNKRHRIFIAINLPSDIRKNLSNYEKKWSELPAKWVRAENLHITLVFLGDLTDLELGEVCMVVKKTIERHKTFNINLNKIGYGPDDKVPFDITQGKPPRFIWAGGEKSKKLSSLKKDLQDLLLEKINFIPELRAFSPHITLARISTFSWKQIEPEERPDVNENIDLNFTVESIEIMESELKKGGPRYTIIEGYQLQ